jgi:hypothetical protein
MKRLFLIGLFFKFTSVFSQCTELDKVKYGGNWTDGDLYYCPAYTFSFDGSVSTKWSILNDPIDIKQIGTYIFPIKDTVEKQIREYSGDIFFSRVKFHSVAIAYPDSIRKFAAKHPRPDIKSCKYKYFFYYKFFGDNLACYNIGIAVDKNGKIISTLPFPKKTEYQPIDTTLNACRVLDIARKVNININPISEIIFDYNPETRKFYWCISQALKDRKQGKNIYDIVIIDAANASQTEIKKREIYSVH